MKEKGETQTASGLELLCKAQSRTILAFYIRSKAYKPPVSKSSNTIKRLLETEWAMTAHTSCL